MFMSAFERWTTSPERSALMRRGQPYAADAPNVNLVPTVEHTTRPGISVRAMS